MTIPEASDFSDLRTERLMPLLTKQNLPNSRLRLTWFLVFFLFTVFFFFDGHNVFRTIQEGLTIEQTAARVEEGGIERRISLLSLFGFGIITLMRKNRKRLQINGFLSWLILFFLALAFFSLAWTNDIFLTFRKVVVLGMFSLAALAVAERFSVRDVNLIAFCVPAGYLLLGLAAEIGLGTFHPLAQSYRFAGTLHPNQQGINCALLVLSSFCLMENGKRGRGFFLTIALVGLVFLILTKSRTSFESTIVALFVYGSLVLSRPRKFALFLSITIAFCLLLLIVGDNLFPALQRGILLGREGDPDSIFSLTQRVPLWKECLEYLVERPLQGYGYGGFWTPQHILKLSGEQGWGFAEAHSGYLEIALGLGLVGAVTYVLILIVGMRRSFILHRASPSTGHAFFAVLLIFCLFENVLESAVVSPTMLAFMSMVALAHLALIDSYEKNQRINLAKNKQRL